jgi:hypothetical protein
MKSFQHTTYVVFDKQYHIGHGKFIQSQGRKGFVAGRAIISPFFQRRPALMSQHSYDPTWIPNPLSGQTQETGQNGENGQ